MAPLPPSCINSAFQLVMPVAKMLFLPKANTKAYLELSRHIDRNNFQGLWKVNYVKSNFKKIQPSKVSRFEPLPLLKKILLVTADNKNTVNWQTLYCKHWIIFMSTAKCSAQKNCSGESMTAQTPSRAHCSSGLAHPKHETARTGGTYPEGRGLELVLQVVHEQREMESQHQEACPTAAE